MYVPGRGFSQPRPWTITRSILWSRTPLGLSTILWRLPRMGYIRRHGRVWPPIRQGSLMAAKPILSRATLSAPSPSLCVISVIFPSPCVTSETLHNLRGFPATIPQLARPIKTDSQARNKPTLPSMCPRTGRQGGRPQARKDHIPEAPLTETIMIPAAICERHVICVQCEHTSNAPPNHIHGSQNVVIITLLS
jgi:hypothetical protein